MDMNNINRYHFINLVWLAFNFSVIRICVGLNPYDFLPLFVVAAAFMIGLDWFALNMPFGKLDFILTGSSNKPTDDEKELKRRRLQLENYMPNMDHLWCAAYIMFSNLFCGFVLLPVEFLLAFVVIKLVIIWSFFMGMNRYRDYLIRNCTWEVKKKEEDKKEEKEEKKEN